MTRTATTDAGTPAARPRRPLVRDRMPLRLVVLFAGLVLFGVSMAMMLQAGLGVGPWDVFHQGLSLHVPLSFGVIVIIVSVLVLALWIPLRERPGLGTIANAIVIGLVVDATLLWLDQPATTAGKWALMLSGVGLNGFATGLYIGAGLGPGPRDGLMTGVAGRGYSIGLVRTLIEVTVLAVGWLLGGVVGVGTLVFAFGIGPLAQVFLPLCSIDERTARRATGWAR